jgi:hypothetical protein
LGGRGKKIRPHAVGTGAVLIFEKNLLGGTPQMGQKHLEPQVVYMVK